MIYNRAVCHDYFLQSFSHSISRIFSLRHFCLQIVCSACYQQWEKIAWIQLAPRKQWRKKRIKTLKTKYFDFMRYVRNAHLAGARERACAPDQTIANASHSHTTACGKQQLRTIWFVVPTIEPNQAVDDNKNKITTTPTNHRNRRGNSNKIAACTLNNNKAAYMEEKKAGKGVRFFQLSLSLSSSFAVPLSLNWIRTNCRCLFIWHEREIWCEVWFYVYHTHTHNRSLYDELFSRKLLYLRIPAQCSKFPVFLSPISLPCICFWCAGCTRNFH